MQRLIAAKSASLYPEIYALIQDGGLNLSAVSRLSSHLTPGNRAEILSRAAGRKRADLGEFLRRLRSAAAEPFVNGLEHEISASAEGGLPFHGEPPQIAAVSRDTAPIGGDDETPDHVQTEQRVRLSLLADERLQRDLERSRRLLKRRCPSGRLEDVIGYLLHDFLRRRDPSLRRPAAERPRRERQTRAVPQWVKDRVWRRDGGRCTYASRSGRRCSSQSGLEYDHIRPWARGGASDEPGNIRLLCRAHNLFVARSIFGDRVPSRRD